MNVTIPRGPRSGAVTIPPSKSQAHRLLILAALGAQKTSIVCGGRSDDIDATIRCLRALGAELETRGETIEVTPIRAVPQGECLLDCGESGSTLRFLLPVAAALGANAVFHMAGRLPDRPLAPLDAQLISHGVTLSRDGDTLRCKGRLTAGAYTLPGDVSSQYITGLLLALPLLSGVSTLTVTGKIESAPYIAMTEDALHLAGVGFAKNGDTYTIPGGQRASLPTLRVEGDWSNAAFFLCMGALSDCGVTVRGLNVSSSQGDRAIVKLLRAFGAQVTEDADAVTVRRGTLRSVTVDAAPIPDLIPAVSVLAAAAEGKTRIENAARLRLKESDRLATTTALLRALGADVTEKPDGLSIRGGLLRGGEIDSYGDHRIAMSAAVAACACGGGVTVRGAECVKKSYPAFWEDFSRLTGGTI
ncbi:MAG: 3-phosphoshikimate 1-carboxyvinyltransferase [Oscillospiraceae bacterium]|nr:3-phosphoshikimate 1-carboxyvinyltransferase [Oscillospiraceae bacterium]